MCDTPRNKNGNQRQQAHSADRVPAAEIELAGFDLGISDRIPDGLPHGAEALVQGSDVCMGIWRGPVGSFQCLPRPMVAKGTIWSKDILKIGTRLGTGDLASSRTSFELSA